MITSFLAEFYGSLDLAVQVGQLFSGFQKNHSFALSVFLVYIMEQP